MALVGRHKACYNNKTSPIRSYNSYDCRNKESYSLQQNKKCLFDPYDDLWGDLNNKPPHISKLRNILTETISNITSGNKLKTGESVELTLEIELMKSETSIPNNSVVEVTIIQHSKAEMQSNRKMITSKVPFQVDGKSSTASEKRRNWFQRVCFNENNLGEKKLCNKNKLKERTDKFSKTRMATEKCRDVNCVCNQKENKLDNPRQNFVTILPDSKLNINVDFKNGYRRVSNVLPLKISPRPFTKDVYQQKNTIKNSLVKKLSDLFLPNKRADNQHVRTALEALKREVDNMQYLPAKNRHDTTDIVKKRAQVQNLGKLVSNVLVEMMEGSEGVKYKNKSSLTYKNFFEPMPTNKNQRVIEKKHKKYKDNVGKLQKRLVKSHSDTCCNLTLSDFSRPTVKTSNSLNDCRFQSPLNNQVDLQSLLIGDSPLISSMNKIEFIEKKHRRKSIKNRIRGDGKTSSNHKIYGREGKKVKQSGLSTKHKESEMQWNGATITVNKEIKRRIEMLIVNELENLALKEGMEYDVTPLPSNENVMKQHVEKVSSFLCELDISNKKMKKVIKSKQIDPKSNINLPPPKQNKMGDSNSKEPKPKRSKPRKMSSKIRKNTVAATNIMALNRKKSNSSLSRTMPVWKNCQPHKEINDVNACGTKDTEADVEVTYMNLNTKNWSKESQTVVFGDSEKRELTTEVESKKRTVTAGFVKEIKSNDSMWKKFLSGDRRREKKIEREIIREYSRQLMKTPNARPSMKYTSTTSNECESSIEIELDIAELELILKEAREKHNASKVLISAKHNRESKKKKKPIKFTGKNSPSYTNELLTRASKKLEKYAKTKR